MKSGLYRRFLKRWLDLAVALPALLLLAPLLALLALLVRLDLGAPVLFRQQRVGWQEKPFTIYKFRTMTDARDAQGCLLPAAQRLTRLGRLLRRTSLDELPQLWNVLTGDMSLVGPRPLYVEYLPCYTERERQRHQLRPGITGLAQVSGRHYLPWDERLELDVRYVERLAPGLDLSILLRTLWKAVAGKDVLEGVGAVQGPLTHYRAEVGSLEQGRPADGAAPHRERHA